MMCLVEDLEENDGSEEKPFYMTTELKSILGVKNKKLKKEKHPLKNNEEEQEQTDI